MVQGGRTALPVADQRGAPELPGACPPARRSQRGGLIGLVSDLGTRDAAFQVPRPTLGTRAAEAKACSPEPGSVSTRSRGQCARHAGPVAAPAAPLRALAFHELDAEL